MNPGAWLALALLAGAPPAKAPLRNPGKISAQAKPSPKRPVQITADSFDLKTEAHQARWQGNVIAVRDDLTVRCQTLVADYDQQKELKKLTCRSEVHMVQKPPAPAPEREAWGDLAVFDNETGVLVVTGDPRAREGDNTFKGDKVTFFVDQNKLHIDKPRGVIDTANRPAPAKPKEAP